MEKITLGINILGHDASLSFFDGKNLHCVDEERFTRFKHDGTSVRKSFINLSKKFDKELEIELCACYNNDKFHADQKFVLKKKIEKEVRKVFNLTEISQQKPILNKGKFNFFISILKKFTRSYRIIFKILNFILNNKSNIDYQQTIREFMEEDLRSINKVKKISFKFFDHHTTHCVGAYFFSPFDQCLSISLDLIGDQYFSKVFKCEKNNFKEVSSSRALKEKNSELVSIGRIYLMVTDALGFTPNSDEGKVEALAAYGSNDNELFHKLISSTKITNNTIVIDEKIIAYLKQNLKKLISINGKKNIAAAVQCYLEEIVVKYVQDLTNHFKIKKICLSGGTFANVKLNMNIFDKLNLDGIYVMPAMTDSGAGLGAMLLGLYNEKKIDYQTFKSNNFSMPYWGPSFTKTDVIKAISNYKSILETKEYSNNEWKDIFANYICEGKIGGLFQGKMEFGPRALGNRSIIGDARNKNTKERINMIIKGRPNFQPFCPSILEEDRQILFERSFSNKHMTSAFKMKKEFAKKLPSAVHIDDTARPQFVTENDNKNFYHVLKKIKEKTGFGVVVNTSFNRHGRTMVLSPSDAIKDFLDSKMDFIAFENIFIFRNNKDNN